MVIKYRSLKNVSLLCDSNSKEMILFFNEKQYHFNKSVVVTGDNILDGKWPCVVYFCRTLLVFLGRY